MKFCANIVFAILIILSGCAPTHIQKSKSSLPPETPGITHITVQGNEAWTETGVKIGKGNCVEIRATGMVEIDQRWRGIHDNYDFQVGPEGTYVVDEEALYGKFPLAAGYGGPAPAYGLIAKVILPDGEEKVFYVGKRRRINCSESRLRGIEGALLLGINEDLVTDNRGEWQIEIEDLQDEDPATVSHQEPVGESLPAKPRVFTIYIDGLRPDVLYEMAYNGMLPHIKEHLFDRGILYENAFTIFPSDTITTNSAWMTGMFTDKTAVKSQSEFDRKTQGITTYLDKYTPTLAANLMKPADEYRVGKTVQWLFYSLFGSHQKARDAKMELEGGVDAIFNFEKKFGLKFRSTVLPILNPHPPINWINLFANNTEWPISAVEGVKAFDGANADYAYRYLMDHDVRILSTWFPGVDVEGHFSARGQFGSSRRYLVQVDRELGRLIAKLKRRRMYDDTIFFLFSDHGHIGGRDFVNQRFNLAFDLFFLPSRDEDDDHIPDPGSGLGLNVKKYDYERFHSIESKNDFVAFDIGSYGTAKIFLPFQGADTGDWTQRNSIQELTAYRVSERFAKVNLLEHILHARPRNPNLYPGVVSDRPIAFLMLPLSGRISAPAGGRQGEEINRILLMAPDGAKAEIEHRSREGVDEFRYRPHRGQKPDPLRYLEDIRPGLAGWKGDVTHFLEHWHTARTWLRATAVATYPNAPVLFLKYFDWHPTREKYRERKTPDLVVVANEGWNFRDENVWSTDHGYPQRDSLRIPLLVAGQGIRKGVVSNEPVLSVDIVPTILQILEPNAREKDPGYFALLDGERLPGLLAQEESHPPFKAVPHRLESGSPQGNYQFAGLERDLNWWGLIAQVPPEPLDTQFHTHDPRRYTDLHNILADIVALVSYEAFHGMDVLFDLAAPGADKRPWGQLANLWLENWDQVPDSWAKRRTGQLFQALRIREFSMGDSYAVAGLVAGFSLAPVPTTLDFLWRYYDLIDFSQDLFSDFSLLVSTPFGAKDLLGVRFLNRGIDIVQAPPVFATRMATKYAFQYADRGLLRFEHGIDLLVNERDKRQFHLAEILDHADCTCTRFIIDLQNQTTGASQGGEGLNIPAPSMAY